MLGRIASITTVLILSLSSVAQNISNMDSFETGNVLTVEMPIRAATLYYQGGKIMREGRITVNTPGTYFVRIPQVLADDATMTSIQIQGATLQSQQSDMVFTPKKINDLITQYYKEENILSGLKDELEQNTSLSKSFIKNIVNHPDKLNEITEKLQWLNAKIMKLREKISLQQSLVDQLKAQLAYEEDDKNSYINNTYLLKLYADKAGEIEIKLSEYSSAASWSASSDVALDTSSNQLKLSAYANIKQNTALDWKNVKLSLAVSSPQYIPKPEFFSLPVSFLLEEKKVVAFESEAIKMDKTASIMLLSKQVDIMRVGQDFYVDLPDAYSLRHGKTEMQVLYWEKALKADTYLAVYNWGSTQALLIAEWIQPDGINFLPGKMRLIRDGNLIANEQYTDLWTPQSKHIISFGADLTVDVKKSIPPEFTDRKKIFNQKRILKVRENFVITNRALMEKTIRFYAQLPVSTDKEIQVTPVWSSKPIAEDIDNYKGIMLWQEKVSPNKIWEINFGYDIAYPENSNINLGAVLDKL